MNPFVQQGWVPKTCTLTDDQVRMLFPLALRGEDVCRGCNADRDVCKGRPKAAAKDGAK